MEEANLQGNTTKIFDYYTFACDISQSCMSENIVIARYRHYFLFTLNSHSKIYKLPLRTQNLPS